MSPVAWVTGASGFLGRHVARRLAAEGWSVVGLSRQALPHPSTWGVSHAFAGSLESTIEAAQSMVGPPEVVVHAVGAGSVGVTAAAPIEGRAATVGSVSAMLRYLRSCARETLFLYPSSAAVYGRNDGEPLAEDRVPAPISEYGRHKLEVEELLEKSRDRYGISSTSIRFFSIYGPELRKQVLWDWGRKILAGENPLRAFGTGEEVRDFIYIDDAVDLLIMLVKISAARRPVVINGGTGQPTKMRFIADSLMAALGRPGVCVFDGRSRIGDPPSFVADMNRLSNMGFAPAIPIDDGMRRYAAWLIGVEKDFNLA